VSAVRHIVLTLLRPVPSLVVWVFIVFIAATVPVSGVLEVDFPAGSDKILLGVAYAVLGLLAVRALWRLGPHGMCVGGALAATVGYGLLLEGWQKVVGRTADPHDVIANTVGAGVGGLVAIAVLLKGRPGTRSERERSDHGHGGRSGAD